MSLVPKNGQVAVVGAGISGLCYAYFLSKIRPDVKISIFEAAREPGGWIKSQKLHINSKEVILEKGPRTLRGISDGSIVIADIMKQLGHADEVEVMDAKSAGNRKWLLDPSNSLVQVPNSVSLFAKFMLSEITSGLIPSILKEPFLPAKKDTNDESVRSFIQRRFGSPAMADNVLSAIMHGIYSGDVSKLSARATIPSMLKLEKEHGSIVRALFRKKTKAEENDNLKRYEETVSLSSDTKHISSRLKKYPIMRLRNGLQTMPLVMAEFLKKQPSIEIFYDSSVNRLNFELTELEVNGKLHQYDHIRFTLGFKPLANITSDIKVKESCAEIEYSTIFLANVFSLQKGLIPKNGNGFGFLVPRRNKNPESLLGVIFDSDTELDAIRFLDGKQFGGVSHDKLTLMIGGHYFNTRGKASSWQNLKATKKVLSDVLGVNLERYNLIIRDEAAEESKALLMNENDLLISFNVHEDCIPLYNVGFLENSSKIASLVKQKSGNTVSLGGPCLGKLGVPDCVMNELEAALAMK